MKLSLQEPFSSKWRLGYIRQSKDGRKRIDLFNSNDDRTTISYARYLMSVKVGRELSIEEEVDHIDGNKTNDKTENLAILSTSEHRRKTIGERPRMKFFYLVCPVCLKEFRRRKGMFHPDTIPNPKCSRRCNGIVSGRKKRLLTARSF